MTYECWDSFTGWLRHLTGRSASARFTYSSCQLRCCAPDGSRPAAVERFQNGHSPQQPARGKMPFVTPRRCGRLSGRFEVGPVRERTLVPVGHRPSAAGGRYISLAGRWCSSMLKQWNAKRFLSAIFCRSRLVLDSSHRLSVPRVFEPSSISRTGLKRRSR